MARCHGDNIAQAKILLLLSSFFFRFIKSEAFCNMKYNIVIHTSIYVFSPAMPCIVVQHITRYSGWIVYYVRLCGVISIVLPWLFV